MRWQSGEATVLYVREACASDDDDNCLTPPLLQPLLLQVMSRVGSRLPPRLAAVQRSLNHPAPIGAV